MNRTTLALAALGLLAASGAPAHADPITYAFQGSLTQPVNGVQDFSGTLTYLNDPAHTSLTAQQESPDGAAATLYLGGQVVHFGPGFAGSGASYAFNPWYFDFTGSDGVSARDGSPQHLEALIHFGVAPGQDALTPGSAAGPLGIATFGQSGELQLAYHDARTYDPDDMSLYRYGQGNITSLRPLAPGETVGPPDPTTVPEPAAWVVFAAVGAVGAWWRGRRNQAPSTL